jgi:hypothetical protein
LFLRISHAVHLDVFDQPGENHFFNKLLVFLTAGAAPLLLAGRHGMQIRKS